MNDIDVIATNLQSELTRLVHSQFLSKQHFWEDLMQDYTTKERKDVSM